jgi:hypothetical protein
MSKYALAVVFVATASSACFAAEQFYVYQDSSTKKCKITTEKPDGVAKITIGTSAYATREEAKTAKHAAPQCNEVDD